MKKTLSLVLAVLMVLSCISLASAEEDRTLYIRMKYHANVVNQAKEGIDYNDNYVTKALEEVAGIDVTYEVGLNNANDELQQKMMMIQSDNCPDAFVNYWNINEYYTLAQEGVLAPLDDYLTEEYLGNYLKYIPMDHLDKFRVDGKLYCLPDFVEQTCNPTTGVLVRKDLFDQMGIAVPETTEEFLNMLRKAKEMWPDKTPLGNTATGGTAYNWFRISFRCYGDIYQKEDGTYAYNITTDNFKRFLEFMNTMNNEKLIEPEWLTISANGTYEKIINDQYFAQLSWWAGPYTQYNGVYQSIDGVDFFYIPFPVENKGDRPLVTAKAIATHYVMIPEKTPDAKKDLVVEYLNFYASDYALRVSLYGVEGENYTLKEGVPAEGWYIPDAVEQTLDENLAVGWRILYDWFTLPAHFEARAEIKHYTPYYEGLSDIGAVAGKMDVFVDPGTRYPKTDDYADMLNTTGIIGYGNEQMALFITGGRSLTEWDAFQAELVERGIEDLTDELNAWVEEYQ